MSLHNLETTLTPDEHTALFNAVMHVRLELGDKKREALAKREELGMADQYLYDNCETAALWLAAQSEKLYQEWAALPAGSHLKEAYSEHVWTWSDRDLAAIPEADLTDLVRPEYEAD